MSNHPEPTQHESSEQDDSIKPPATFAKKVYRGAYWLDRFIEHNPFMRLIGIAAALVTMASVVYTMIGVRVQIEDSALVRNELQEAQRFRLTERVELTKQRIERREAGDTGKGRLLTWLFENFGLSHPTDVSCYRIGIVQEGRCEEEIVLSDVEFTLDFMGIIRTPTPWLIADGVTFRRADFGGYIAKIDGSFITFQSVHAPTTELEFDGSEISFFGSDMAGMMISGQIQDLAIERSNISAIRPYFVVQRPTGQCRLSEVAPPVGLPICDATTIQQMFDRVWFWADSPPRVQLEVLEAIVALPTTVICEYKPDAGFGPVFRVGNTEEYEIRRSVKNAQGDETPFENRSGYPVTCLPVTFNEASEAYPHLYDGSDQFNSDCLLHVVGPRAMGKSRSEDAGTCAGASTAGTAVPITDDQ